MSHTTHTATPAPVKPLDTKSSSGALRIHKPASTTVIVRSLLGSSDR